MSTDLKASVLAAAAADPSPTRAAIKRRNVLMGMLAAATGVGAFVIFAVFSSEAQLLRLGGEEIASHRYLERSVGLVVTTTGGALAVAVSALWLALYRGRSMLGRPRGWLVCGITLIPLVLLAWKVSSSLVFGDPMAAWPMRPGLKCFSLSLFVAAGPLLTLLALRRRAPVHPALNGAVIGVASGACAWVGLDLWCPVAFVPHLLLGHLLPLCILGAAGALLGQLLLSLRSRSR